MMRGRADRFLARTFGAVAFLVAALTIWICAIAGILLLLTPIIGAAGACFVLSGQLSVLSLAWLLGRAALGSEDRVKPSVPTWGDAVQSILYGVAMVIRLRGERLDADSRGMARDRK